MLFALWLPYVCQKPSSTLSLNHSCLAFNMFGGRFDCHLLLFSNTSISLITSGTTHSPQNSFFIHVSHSLCALLITELLIELIFQGKKSCFYMFAKYSYCNNKAFFELISYLDVYWKNTQTAFLKLQNYNDRLSNIKNG